MKLLDILYNVVNQSQDPYAYIVNDECMTYSELLSRAEHLASVLRCKTNASVLLYGHKSPDMLVGMVACLIAKLSYIPVEQYIPLNRLKEIIKISNAKMLINTTDEKLDIGIETCSVDQLLSVDHEHGNPKKTDNNIAYIIFTSGSTGEPKGVPVSYDALDNFVDWINTVESMQSDRKLNVLDQASFSFDLSVADVYYALSNGHTLVALDSNERKDISNVTYLIKERQINAMVVTPSFVRLLMLDGEFNCEVCDSLRWIYFCGETLEVSTVKKLKVRFPNLCVINAYGPTEATSAVCAIEVDDDMLDEDSLPVGDVSQAACIIEIENDEIILTGKSVFSGYLGGITGGHFKKGRIDCFRTGDQGRIENGLLYCCGRFDNQIKYMGYRIELGDIESNLSKIDGVRQAVVIAKFKGRTKTVKTIKAYVSLDDGVELNYVRAELEKMVPEYMIPKSIIKIDDIPLNKNGKADRKRLEKI